MVDNYTLAEQFSLLSKLMDIHGENPFKSKSYSSAAFAIEKAELPLADLPEEKLFKVKGIGESTGKKIREIVENGRMAALEELLSATPEGVLEIMNIKGLGPKKINTLWKEMGLRNLEELEEACRQNRVAQKKGFGEKTEAKILESIEFVRSNKGRFLYKDVEAFAVALQAKLEAKFPTQRFAITGEFYRQLEIVSRLEWVTTASSNELKNFLQTDTTTIIIETDDLLIICAENSVDLHFHFSNEKNFGSRLVNTSSTTDFLNSLPQEFTDIDAATEADFFAALSLPYVPAYRREFGEVLNTTLDNKTDTLVQTNSIKGLIHSHSNWSDGAYTLEQMAEELIRTGFEYLVISDHSKSAGYAGGLSEDRIREQHKLIDELNKKLAPFKIFKSIECDILGDGSLDYAEETLKTFDLVITSIHSNLDMDEDKAMMRLMGAISNPYTTILGHMTGRLLLRRKGYPVDHKKIIDACAANNVVIEINSSPYRLDIDWRWISYALEKGVMLSINPDAHSLDEFPYVRYGTLVAQKGGLTADRNLSSFSLTEFEAWLRQNREKKGLLS